MKGAAWTYVAFFSRRFVTFLSTMVLVRFVGPEGFGLMAAALLVIRYFDAVNDAGVGAAMVQYQSDPEKTVNVAMLISLGMGIVLTTLSVLSAPYVANFFHQPELKALLWFLSPIFLFSSFAQVQGYWLKKTFRFAERVVPEISSVLVKAFVSILFAILGFGVWSLAFGQMSGQITASIAYWRVTRNQLSLAFDRKIAYRLLSFGTKLSVITFVGILSQTVDQVVIARYLDASQLGYFVLGSMLPELAVMGVCVSASQVFFPTFSRVQAKPRLLRASYLLSLKYVVMITFPVAIGVAIVAEDFVTIAYSELWAASVPIIQILALSALLKSVAFSAGDVLKATGKTGLLSRLIVLRLVISVPVLLLFVGKGIVAIALVTLGTNIVVMAITMVVVMRQLSARPSALLFAILPALIATGVMALACVGITLVGADLNVFTRLILTILTGALVYGVTLWMLDRTSCETVINFVARKDLV